VPTSLYRWEDEEKRLSVFCRETGKTIYECYFASFRDAKEVADAFLKLYEQGVRHGKQFATEEMQRTVDHINRNL
jgi:hypothetical protein